MNLALIRDFFIIAALPQDSEEGYPHTLGGFCLMICFVTPPPPPLVRGPKYPVEGRPTDAWYALRAFSVAGPKYEVSWPGEPGPVFDTVNPLELRKDWRLETSGPFAWRERFRENEADEVCGADMVSALVRAVVASEEGMTPAWTRTSMRDAIVWVDMVWLGDEAEGA